MKLRVLALLTLVALLGSGAMAAAQNTGEIYGKVTDASGGVMPGVTVTLSSTVLLQPQTAITAETGTFRFPQLSIGLYNLKYELAGFKTVIKEGIRVEIGLSAQMNQALEISTLQETVTVSGETPLVDLKDTGKTNRFTQEALQSIPSARDPWVIIEQSAGVAMDRQNVGGSASGQQSNFVARGAAMAQQKWNLDGVDVTDMNATGGSPVYYDFDAFEEMQISTGGADVSMQSPGVGINLVTKSGTDKFRGSGRFYVTDKKFQSFNVTDDLRKNGASTGNPILNIKDYGGEAGGPLKKGRAWIWGSIGKQNVNVGINNFYKADAACQAMKAAPLTFSLKDIRECLSPDTTLLNNYNAKFALEAFHNNQLSVFYNAAEKVRNARDGSDARPLETTYRQLGVTRKDLGSSWWKTGMPKTYKFSDRHIFSDRFMVEASYAHVGNNFALTFHDESLRDVQPAYDISNGYWARSYQEAVYVRPTDSVDVIANYFLPSIAGGDHAIKFGMKYRNDHAFTESSYGGDAYARFGTFTAMNALEAQIYRRSVVEYVLHNRSVYLQDTYSRKKLMVNVGVRFDYQNDAALANTAPASWMFGKATYVGEYNGVTYTGATFNQLPALSFPGKEAPVTFKNFSPRVGITYDLMGDGRTVAKFNYSRYVSQLGSGGIASTYNTVASTFVRYPWVDINGDKFIQANEVVLRADPLSWTSGYDYKNPTATSTTGTVDPNLKMDTTNEIMVSFDKQFGNQFAVSASYIWRKYSNFAWSDTLNWTSANYEQKTFTPTGCRTGARCETVTYYQPTSQIPTGYIYTNRPDYSRGYNGIEISARKRMANHFSANASFSYNDAKVHYDSPASYEDPTNVDNLNHGQYAPESTSSGLGNVFVNAKWIARVSGVVQAPFGINAAVFYNARSGYPFIQTVQTTTRPFSAGTASVYLDKLGDNRLPNFQTADFRIDRAFTLFNHVKVVPAIDIFNIMNGHTSLSIRGTQNSSTSNDVSSLLAPRVFRFGARVSW